MPPNPLDSPTTHNHLCTLAWTNYLTEPALEHALRRIGIVPDAAAWRHFIDKMLLLLGTTLLLVGIIFFFAYNWADMNHFVKFGLLEVGIVSLALFVSWRGLDRLSAQAALLAAAVLLGALLAVYGQKYQTGADAFSLFLSWAILIIPWVLLGAFAPLWLLLLVLLNLSLVLYWVQVIQSDHYTALFLLLFLFNGVAMFVWEFAYKQGFEVQVFLSKKLEPRNVLKGYWLGVVIFCVALTFIMVPSLHAIVDFGQNWQSHPLQPIALILYIGSIVLVLWYYRYQRHDLLLLAISLLGVIIVLTTLLAKLLLNDEFTWLLLALAVVGQVSLATKWLLHIAKTWKEEV
jgi:uncharacterized membrane protein